MVAAVRGGEQRSGRQSGLQQQQNKEAGSAAASNRGEGRAKRRGSGSEESNRAVRAPWDGELSR
jgi:hypothetical protein